MNKPTAAQLLRVFNRYELIEIALDDFTNEQDVRGGDVELRRLYFGHAAARVSLEAAMIRRKRELESNGRNRPVR